MNGKRLDVRYANKKPGARVVTYTIQTEQKRKNGFLALKWPSVRFLTTFASPPKVAYILKI